MRVQRGEQAGAAGAENQDISLDGSHKRVILSKAAGSKKI